MVLGVGVQFVAHVWSSAPHFTPAAGFILPAVRGGGLFKDLRSALASLGYRASPLCFSALAPPECSGP